MKELYLIRHAKSNWEDPQLADMDRPLNWRGKRDAVFMAEKLVEKGMNVDALYASPSKRTQATAAAFADALNYSLEDIHWDERVYEASAETLLQVVQQLPDHLTTVALFAHNFGCTDFANYYAMPNLENVPTTGTVHFSFEVSKWATINKKNGTLLSFEYPKLYFSKKK